MKPFGPLSPPSSLCRLLPLLLLLLLLLSNNAASATAVGASTGKGHGDGGLPIVNLGYVKQQASNETAGYYVFQNIRFAAPPLGNLRLRRPQPPRRERAVHNGLYPFPTACDSAEDCLFLNVWVPKGVTARDRVPVLGYWHGGGYVAGSKGIDGLPPMYSASGPLPPNKRYIFVSANYRLGALGFLAPDNADVDPNVGLHDGRMAMEWIGRHIAKFGGDPDNVTAMGFSAGGGVIQHALVSYGGGGPKLPFHKMISRSPGWVPDISRKTPWAEFRKATGCADAVCIRRLPTAAIVRAQALTTQKNNLEPLKPLFMPVVDGEYVPDEPMSLLKTGKFHREVASIVVSSARWEGNWLVPETMTPAEVAEGFYRFSADQAVVDQLLALYPAANGDPTAHLTRYRAFVSDLLFNCNSYYEAQAFLHAAFRYMFNADSARHGVDEAYTFGNDSNARLDQLVRREQQSWIVDYVVDGPQALAGRSWPQWDATSGLGMWMNQTGLAMGTDYFAWADNAEKCRFLERNLPSHAAPL